MKATNMIKINGVWYRAGDELPADRTPKVEPVKPSLDVNTGEPKITRAEIEEMKYFTLKSLAEKNGVSVKDKPANIIRRDLYEVLGI